MTCREFKQDAGSLTLSELSAARDAHLLNHAEECQPCGAWFERERAVAVSLRALQGRTSSLEAGPDVERAVLRAFRQATPTSAVLPVFSTVSEATAVGTDAAAARVNRIAPLHPRVTPGSTPVAMRLSRVFEIGAYLAVAAALIIGVFLGVQLLQRNSLRQPAPESASVKSLPGAVQASPTMADKTTKPAPVSTEFRQTASARLPRIRTDASQAAASQARGHLESVNKQATQTQVAEETQTTADADYVALMFCDPLSCSADSQVVRMDLSDAGSQNAQPQMADVVVGYDGVVRAVRIVN